MSSSLRQYRLATSLIAPLVPLWLYWRRLHGKEDPLRIRERFGYASANRPEGTLVWLHAASVGEANSVLFLIQKICERFPDIKLLLTTGTLTSAQLMLKRLPKGVLHQYVPVDTPDAVKRFMRHWHPDIAFWVESEFWPNLIMTADDYECFMGIINARMSEKSYMSWRKRRRMIATMLECFNVIFAQSDDDAKRLTSLGAKDVMCVGNLKYDAAPLPCNESELISLQSTLDARPLWLAASTHPGEEDMVAAAHALLSATRPGLLTIIVPRHPQRGAAIAAELRKKWTVALRSQKEPITASTQFYVADTLGELGLFYRLCDIAFMGGSLVNHGGQNPLEPARLSCSIIAGEHTHNFADMYAELDNIGGCLRATGAQSLAAQVDMLLNNANTREKMRKATRQWVDTKGGTVNRLLETLGPVFSLTGKVA